MKRDTEKLNKAMLDEIETPDSVLDAARAEMAKKPGYVSSPAPAKRNIRGGRQSGGSVAVNRKLIGVLSACGAFALCLAVIICVILLPSPSNASDATYSYYLSELEKEQISSLDEYNAENNTSYLAVTITDTTTYKYSGDDKTVLFIQNFSYENTEYIWYAVADADDTLDVLKNYVDTDDNEQIEEFYVTYGTCESEVYAKFSHGGSLYLIVSEADTTTLREVLLKII